MSTTEAVWEGNIREAIQDHNGFFKQHPTQAIKAKIEKYTLPTQDALRHKENNQAQRSNVQNKRKNWKIHV